MIFNKFFTKIPNFKHKKSTVRILAINEELSAQADENILLSIANDDQNELVQRAALLKLNNFEHWYNASKHNHSDKIKLFAEQQVQKYLQGKDALLLTKQQKQRLLQDKHNIAFLESWLYQETSADSIIEIFTQLNQQAPKAQRIIQLFERCQNNKVQLFLCTLTDDINLLEKMLKKISSASNKESNDQNQEVCQTLQAKIYTLKEQIEKPIKVHKQVQLLLSKYLALKEQTNFAYYNDKITLFKQQWQVLHPDLDCLAKEQQVDFENKYDQIQQQLASLFAPKAEAFKQEQIAQQFAKDKAQATENFNQTMLDINQVLSNAVFENTPLNDQTFTEQLNQLEKDITASVLSSADQQNFKAQVQRQQQRLSQLPEIAESVSQATYHISTISQLALPKGIDELNDREQTFNSWLDQWHIIEQKSDNMLPVSIQNAYQEVVKHWRTGLNDLKQQQNKHFHQCKKKLHDLQRLITQGKYKACFGVFKGVNSAFVLLNAQQQRTLQRDFDKACEKMAELSDWEHYIATPRKQQLLSEIMTLVEHPLDNPNEQADKVKAFRKTWNSLGHADEDIDKGLNDQFNTACEQAFAPCRLFYAEQDNIRTQHLVARKGMIEQAKVLCTKILPSKELSENDALKNNKQNSELENTPLDHKQLEAELNKLQQQWRNAGNVDRAQYQILQSEFNQVLEPIKQIIKSFHNENISLKQSLIKQAQQACLTDDVFSAIETVKSMQQQWRSIGFAGHHQENKLWQTFRKANDAVFAKRDVFKNEQQQQQKDFIDQQSVKLALIETSLVNKTLTNESSSAIETQETLLIETEALLSETIAEKPVIKSLVQHIEKILAQLKANIVKIKQQQEHQAWFALFDVFSLLATQSFSLTDTQSDIKDKSPAFIELSSFWQKRIVEYLNNMESMANRNVQSAEQVLELEILAGKDSPQNLSQQRMVLQVKLMQQQMTSGESSDNINLSKKLVTWLQLGKLTKDDLAYIERLKSIFC